jgi:DNA-binding NtrC family response regulator
MTTDSGRSPAAPILFVDDEAQFLHSAAFTMLSAGLGKILTCQDSREVMGLLERQPVSIVVLDMMMPHVTGRELLPAIAEKFPALPVIMLTAVNEVETAVDCMKAGAFDYLVKPVDKARLTATVRRALDTRALQEENRSLTRSLLSGTVSHPEHFEEIVTRHSALFGVFQYIEAVSRTSLPLLITGETGSGKELVARAFHKATGRRGEFVAVNAAGLDDMLFSDTLFGHEKGAFTGAAGKRDGLIARAAGGTIFLDEIGDLRMESQVKLLRLIDEKAYYPVGADQPIASDVRIVAATNRDLAVEQQENRFRKDLYYRLQSHHVHLPPLRQRVGDLPLLIDYFVEQASAELNIPAPTVPPQLYVLLGTYHFHGNVRELRGMIFDAVSRHSGGVLSLDSFKTHLDRNTASAHPPLPPSATPGAKVIFTEQLPTLAEMDALLVEEALRRSQQNQSIASRILGITRSALNKRINHPR